MGLPKEPVNLSPLEIEELNAKLRKARHDINGDLTLIVAASELIKMNPAVGPLIQADPQGSVARMVKTLLEQPHKIRERIEGFSAEFERALDITRP